MPSVTVRAVACGPRIGLHDPECSGKNGLSNPETTGPEIMSSDTRQAGPRLTRKGKATRARIVAAAAQLIYEQGVGAATLEEVRAAARVSGSQIYHYFSDKQALLLAVIEYQTDAVLGLQ